MNVIDRTHSKPNQFKSIFHLYEIPINLSKKHTKKKRHCESLVSKYIYSLLYADSL